MNEELSIPSENTASYRVKLEHFEGPLDLLLHLIKKNELDVCEVSLTRIADQYLDYVTTMELLNLEIAGEFILVAATLMLLKSRALLPSDGPHPEDDEEDFVSPAELIRRLLLYKKYKEGAQQLRERHGLFHDVFLRQAEDPIWEQVKEIAPALEVSVFALVEAFQAVLKKAPKTTVHEISGDPISIGQRMKELLLQLKEKPMIEFADLFEGHCTRPLLIATFLSVLEMTRLALIRIYQIDAFKPLRVELLMTDVDEGIQRIHLLLDQADQKFQYVQSEILAQEEQGV